MRIFVTGDTHSEPIYRFRSFLLNAITCGHPSLNKDDVMIVAGDFGVIWGNGSSVCLKSENTILDALENMPFTTLFIDGNHENFDRLMQFPTESRYNGEVGVLRPSVLHLRQRGHVYTIGEKKVWCFGGGISVDKNYRKKGRDWWPQEEPSTAEYCHGIEELAKHKWRVDCAITHAGPQGAVDAMNLPPLRESFGEMVHEYDPVSPYLEFISRKLNFDHWFFGHYHEDIEQLSSKTAVSGVNGKNRDYTALYRAVYRLL